MRNPTRITRHAVAALATASLLSGCALEDDQGVHTTERMAASTPPPSTVYEILYNGQYPKRRESGWSEGLQGVASTSSHWYFMQLERIWKFPVGHDLNRRITAPDPAKGILRSWKLGGSDTPPLLQGGYDHFGDGDVHDGKLYVPVEGAQPPVIAVFDADTLEYLGGDTLPLQDRAGWCAIEPNSGRLYTSNNHIDGSDPVFIYDIHWGSGGLTLTAEATLTLRKPDGSRQNIAKYMQGGDFSDDGSTLFLSNGKAKNFDADDGGVWAFDTTTGTRLLRSSQGGDFAYEFHPGAPKYEEPEGLTWQPHGAGSSPGIPFSQLHVILLDNDWIKGREDSFYLKHYMVHDDGGIPPLAPANLVAESVSVSVGTPASTTMNAHVEVGNHGQLDSEAWTATLYLSTSSTSWSSPVRTYDGSGPGIDSGETYARSFVLDVTGVPAGTYYLHVVVDEPGGGATDDNHAVSAAVTKPITDIAGPPADLAIDYVGAPAGPFDGQDQLPIAFSVTNEGTKSGPWIANFWAIRSPDLSGEMVFLGHGSSGPLGAGESVQRVEHLPLSGLAGGHWYVLMQLVPEDEDAVAANNLKISATTFELELGFGW